jgi:hypothetical protein
MQSVRLPVLAGLFVSFVVSASAATYTADFATDPALGGWQTFGDTNLFQWNATNRLLQVTWDSTQTNSYFFHPLDFPVTANDDFSVEFDLNLKDIASGTEPDKTGPMDMGFEFMNLAEFTDPAFMREVGYTPNIAGFDYYTDGYFDYYGAIYPSPATAEPAFVSAEDYYAPQALTLYEVEMPTNQIVHISFAYTASNQTAVIAMTTNGVSVATLPPLALTSANGFTEPDYTLLLDTFCIASFSSYEDYSSVLAHGTIANLVVSEPPPAQNLAGTFSNGVWQVQFTDHLGWVYTLQRTTNFSSWQDVSSDPGNGTNLILSDASAPAAGACYRVSAKRP